MANMSRMQHEANARIQSELFIIFDQYIRKYNPFSKIYWQMK
jgi:hypothetical protein